MASKDKVLVVDDDASAREILVRRLQREGYETAAAGDGLEALETVRRVGPDLVLIDVTMPRMDGHEAVRRLRADPQTALTPIILLSCSSDPEDKISGLEEGADDYIVKPFEPREMLARLRSCLERSRKLKALSPSRQVVDIRKIDCLRHVLKLPQGKVTPEPDAASPFGYRYGGAESPFPADPEEARLFLYDLASAGCVAPEFFETIHLCRACRRYNLNFREVCASCASPDIETTSLIHHFRCAFVAPVAQYVQGSRYVCPKCDRELRHIGVDYDKPSDAFGCRRCGAAFREPQVASVCLACGAQALADELVIERVQAFRLTPKGRLAAESGHLYEIDFGRLMEDAPLRVLAASQLEPTLEMEVARAQRFDRPLSLLLMTVDDLEERVAADGTLAAASLLREAAEALRASIRETDLPCRFGESGLACVLPETTDGQAAALAEALRERLAEPGARDPLSMSIAIAALAPGHRSGREFLEAAVEELEAQRAAIAGGGGGSEG